MSAEPLTREEVREWSTMALREHTAGVSWSVLDRMIATLKAAEERAERLRAALEEHTNHLDELATRPQYDPVLHHQQIDNIRSGMRDALADDDAARGER